MNAGVVLVHSSTYMLVGTLVLVGQYHTITTAVGILVLVL